jgi:serine/threonine protein kinase
MPSLDPVWQIIKPDYKLLSILGQGTFGQVIHAMHRDSRTNVAIKYIKTKFDN